MSRFTAMASSMLAMLAICLPAARAEELAPSLSPESDLCWHSDYSAAYDDAKQQGKLLLIYFQDTTENPERERFETETLTDPEVLEKLERYVLARILIDAKIGIDGDSIRLLDHASFTEMLGAPGVAIVDLEHKETDYYGYVVSTFPFEDGKYYVASDVLTILDLPPGTLTQRTMIYAVRTHPEAPQSTEGEFNSVLAEEAEQHSQHQSRIHLQGHHDWETRFHRINGRIGGGTSSQEVVAESWGGQHLVEAAVECVRCWRLSPGHWGAVRRRHRMFGYDIKRGSNGIWYATGIFANLLR